jgi:hypothetical protein
VSLAVSKCWAPEAAASNTPRIRNRFWQIYV